MTDEDRAEVPEAFALLTGLVAHYVKPEDKEVLAFLPKARRLTEELLREKSSKERRESGGDCEGTAGGGG